MKKFSFQFVVLPALLFVFFSACKKSSGNPVSVANQQQFTAVSGSDGEAEDIYNNVFDNVVGINGTIGLGTGSGVFGLKAPKKGTFGGPVAPCFTVSIDSTAGSGNGFPITVSLNFGTGCTGTDQHLRAGIINTVFSGPLLQSGSSATTTFAGYYIDGVNVTGTHIITNNSTGSSLILGVQVINGKLTAASGNYIAWNRNKTWTQTAGQGTSNLLDDVYNITGSSSGTVFVNDSTYQWTTNISSSNPEVRQLTCPWIVKGQNQITWNTLDATLDFGPGTCDDQATVTTANGTFNVTLP